jgi:hypothetical protein
MAGRPFQSRLTPHFELIAALRRQRKGWQEITDHLATLGVKTDKGNLCAFLLGHGSGNFTTPENPSSSCGAARSAGLVGFVAAAE